MITTTASRMSYDADRNHSQNSAYFWFDKALIGEVYTALRPRLNAWRMAINATASSPTPWEPSPQINVLFHITPNFFSGMSIG